METDTSPLKSQYDFTTIFLTFLCRLADALQRLNITVTEQKLKSLIDGVDKNKNGQIEFDEFVEVSFLEVTKFLM